MTLVRFDGKDSRAISTIMPSEIVGEIKLMTNFVGLKASSTYNAILGKT